jgi:crossover junction endodeoxyribonuclease RusA
MKITLPWPPSKLSPNARIHWAPKRKLTQEYRSACFYEARKSGVWPLDCDKLPLTITFCPPDRRGRDRDNMIASFKAGQDGLSDAVGIDDKHFIPTYRVEGTIKGGAVIVEFAA